MAEANPGPASTAETAAHLARLEGSRRVLISACRPILALHVRGHLDFLSGDVDFVLKSHMASDLLRVSGDSDVA